MRTAAPILALLLAGPLAVHADPAATPPADGSRVEITFDSIDRNADRRISRTEAGYYKYLIDRFASIDTDADGFISREELYASFTASSTHSTAGR